MLSRSESSSGRPLPPSRVRRTTSGGFGKSVGVSPPPPYAKSSTVSFPSTLSDEHIARLASEVSSSSSSREPRLRLDSSTFNRLDEKTREELSDLLIKADGLIKERENELGLASAVAKSLYDSNVGLKSQHQTLLSRFPISPTASPYPPASPLEQTPHFYTNSLPHSQVDSFTAMMQHYKRRSRKISVSQGDLDLLADQNAELIQKLETLESESANGDRAGRRELKKLEREISLLRHELDKTQARSEELEEKARAGTLQPLTAEELERRKQDRVARTLALKPAPSEDDKVMDFAPSNPITTNPIGGPPIGRRTLGSTALDSDYETPARDSSCPQSDSIKPLVPSSGIDSDSVASLTVQGGESLLVSQLLLKIQELEETNLRILSRQEDTTRRLLEVRKETEGMSRLYECLNDQNGEFELEMLEGASPPDSPPDQRNVQDLNETIRFKNFRKTLEADIARMVAQAASRSDGPSSQSNRSVVHKSRKSVMELFTFPNVPPGDDARPPSSPALSSVSFNSLGMFSPPHQQHPSEGQDGITFPEAPSPFSANSPTLKPTLENELGGEFGSWGNDRNDYHLRSTSLFGFTNPFHPSSGLASPSVEAKSTEGEKDNEEPKTPVMQPGPQLTFDSATPQKMDDVDRGDVDSTPTKESMKSLRNQRLSQTIRGRTAKWADGRFKNSLGSIFGDDEGQASSSSAPPSALLPSAATETDGNGDPGSEGTREAEEPPPLLASVSSALDAVFGNFQRTNGASESERKGRGNETDEREKFKHSGVAKTILELWLWLQFVIIILIFIAAMVHRGPRSVLSEAKSRRAVDHR